MSQRIAVIGAGTIGASWAAIFLARGHDVAASDPSPSGEAFARRFIDNAWPALEALGLVVPGASPTRFSFHATPAGACEGASFVQESGPEREDLKIEVFAAIDAACPADVVIASSSSGLLISRVTVKCKHPERCVIGHPFNPPHLIPLVEVVGGDKTSPEAITKAMEFYRALGKHPIHIRKEVRGHVANRLQAALWREAVSLVADGVVSVADADAAIAYGPGLRWALMGPHLTFHLAGGEGGMPHFMSHLGPAVQTWMDDLGAPRLTAPVQKAIIDGVAEEANGRTIPELQKWRDRKLIEILKVSNSA
ncbi:MAG: 3-hydroxyacyl-CoA dehydrogenase NAD-binding domain-containing protein [Pseudolabrys sp.]|nr:3-hydroxyacyl-CoA dehydrogenase NAD-binding domain-containing protein [Pseudolabrys sp.]MDP2298213.1 3-hydroxyacyl-CoA dehydrogenase NAD-binding domain-containing protein [Pseudolabrys sp.]